MESMWKNSKAYSYNTTWKLPDLKFAYIRDLGCSRFWIKARNGKVYYLQVEHGPLKYWNKKIHNPVRHALWYGIERYRNPLSETDTFPDKPDWKGTIRQEQLNLLLEKYAIQYIQN